jgi:hypothetical protein
MTTPGRKFEAVSGSGYRYSINGQEKEKDLNENITTHFIGSMIARIGRSGTQIRLQRNSSRLMHVLVIILYF